MPVPVEADIPMALPSDSLSETESLNDQDIWDDRDGDAIFDGPKVRSQLRHMTICLLRDTKHHA